MSIFLSHISANSENALGKKSRKKAAVLLDFVQIRGGEGPAQFFGTFSEVQILDFQVILTNFECSKINVSGDGK